jgi:hypothetical protein
VPASPAPFLRVVADARAAFDALDGEHKPATRAGQRLRSPGSLGHLRKEPSGGVLQRPSGVASRTVRNKRAGIQSLLVYPPHPKRRAMPPCSQRVSGRQGGGREAAIAMFL